MKRSGATICFFLLILGTGLAVAHPLAATEEFRAKLLNKSGLFSDRMITIKIKIEGYTTAEDITALSKIYDEKGVTAYMNALKNVDKGVINFLSTRGLNLRIIASKVEKTESGKKYTLGMERQSWDTETNIRVDRHYLYMVMELDVDENGKGTGILYKSADFRLGGSQIIEITDSLTPLPVHNVRQTK
ncbi:MAG: hypothetical protein MUP70_07445 [Candidatus Aminicenantes bacterium]|nr:hypothetical protein [Candidatus Aminicenantes bacterium]